MTNVSGRQPGSGAHRLSPVEAWTARCAGLAGSLTPEALAAWQLNRLRQVLAYVRQNSRFYREAFRDVAGASWPTRVQLGQLPFTWPSDLARDPFAFLCVPCGEVARVTTVTTSGTTGERKRVFFTQHDLQRTVDFFEQGMQTLVSPGQHVLILMSGETEHSIARLLEAGLARFGVTARIRGRDWGLDDALAAARRADCIVGIPADVICMCRSDAGVRPRSVLLSADYVPQSVIACVEHTWHCCVCTHYGMTEIGFGGAVQCAAGEGHHLRSAELIVEIVDPVSGASLAPGQLGEIALTSLASEAMPLIRYRTGDMARMVDEPCGCGGVLPRLGRVEGRRENDFSLGNGHTVSIHLLDEVVFAVPGVRAFEAALRNDGRRQVLQLTIDATEPLDGRSLAAKLPGSIGIAVEYAEVNPFSARAKRRIFTNT
jgi:phenylacetate-CoA ligase